jgi:hypothetical protein
MSWLKLPFLFWLALSGWACRDARVTGEVKTQPDANARAAEEVITLRREDGGWGVGPVYKLTIYSDGGVVFEGKKNVRHAGIAKSSISRRELQRLIDEFEKVDYFSLADNYLRDENCPIPSFDTPIVITSLTYKGRSKSVAHDTGCKGTSALEKLAALENLIEEVTRTEQWIK